MDARPTEFRHSRSVTITFLSILISAAGLTFLTFEALGQETWTEGWGVIGEVAILIAIGVVFFFARCASRPNGQWQHLPTRARMRRIGRWTFAEDDLEEISAAVATGDPRIFLPLPQPEVNGPVWLEVWSADDENRAWMQLVWSPTSEDQRRAPFVEISGDSWRDLIEAEARGRGEID